MCKYSSGIYVLVLGFSHQKVKNRNSFYSVVGGIKVKIMGNKHFCVVVVYFVKGCKLPLAKSLGLINIHLTTKNPQCALTLCLHSCRLQIHPCEARILDSCL